MERQTDKHNPRVDEEMKKETQSFTQGDPVDSRAQESREKEPTELRSRDELELRTNIARYVRGSIFPATRDAILRDAQEMGAPDEVVSTLKRLPEGRYEGFPEVWEAIAA